MLFGIPSTILDSGSVPHQDTRVTLSLLLLYDGPFWKAGLEWFFQPKDTKIVRDPVCLSIEDQSSFKEEVHIYRPLNKVSSPILLAYRKKNIHGKGPHPKKGGREMERATQTYSSSRLVLTKKCLPKGGQIPCLSDVTFFLLKKNIKKTKTRPNILKIPTLDIPRNIWAFYLLKLWMNCHYALLVSVAITNIIDFKRIFPSLNSKFRRIFLQNKCPLSTQNECLHITPLSF